jgi:hypothetical protein
MGLMSHNQITTILRHYRPQAIVGMETSGAVRNRLLDAGITTISVDVLPSVDNSPCHLQADVFDVLNCAHAIGHQFEFGLFHPTCTYLTNSAAWAYADPDFDRYPGVGYHQKVQPGTLVGFERRAAREVAITHVRQLASYTEPLEGQTVKRMAVENPVGVLSSRFRKPDQIIQPYQFGDDASKATCLWLSGLPNLRHTRIIEGRTVVKADGTRLQRWANQTDSGQNRLSPSDDRWQERSKTFAGIADAMVNQWAPIIRGEEGWQEAA